MADFIRSPLARSTRNRRSIQTESLTPQENLALLNSQRTVRPNSPHLTIYQPQVCTGVLASNRESRHPSSHTFIADPFASTAHLGPLLPQPNHRDRPLRPSLRRRPDFPPPPHLPRSRQRSLDRARRGDAWVVEDVDQIYVGRSVYAAFVERDQAFDVGHGLWSVEE